MKTAVLILTWNGNDTAPACVQAVVEQQHTPDVLLVVDNASTDGTVATLRDVHPDLMLIENERNLGFSQGMNVGLLALQQMELSPDVVVLLNQDTVPDPTWLAAIVAPLRADPQVAAVGCKIRYPDGLLQHAGVTLEYPRAVAHHVGSGQTDSGQYDEATTYPAVTGAALALRMSALQAVGLFDVGYTPAYYEDADLCWRLRHAGYTVLYQPTATLVHHESLSIRQPVVRSQYYNRGRLRYVLKTLPVDEILGAFAAAEQAFITLHLHPQEARALRWAYIETLLNLDGILRARTPLHTPVSPAEAVAVEAMLLDCKQTLTQRMQQRMQVALDEMHAAMTAPTAEPER